VTASRRAWLVWGTGVAVYVVAVLQRTSLGVSGLDAVHRFGASAGVLATFAVLQLAVYATLQIPVGVAIDHVGPRRLIVTGALTMAAGQAALALAHSVPVAIAARVLVGAGDAMTFISVLRLVSVWFPAHRVPLVTQLTGILGQTGQLLSAIPLVALLHGAGWTTAFMSASGVGVVAAAAALALLRDAPPGAAVATPRAPSMREVGDNLRTAWRHPGTRLGLWAHFTSQFSGTVFALLWGFPFLVSGEGLSRAAAGALLSTFVLAGMVAAPFMGVFVANHPLRRSWLVLGVTGVTASTWAAVLALPNRAPMALLVVLVLVLALGGPGSLIGFDYARTFNPPNRLGTATGIVNVGGFVAALVTILLIGLVLDATSSAGAYTLGAFRVALSVQFAVWLVGVTGFLRTRRVVRARLAREGVVVPPIREVIAREKQARRDRRRPQH
jgi:sugar phosphate permease